MSRARTLLVAANDDFLDSVADWVARDGRFEVIGRVHTAAAALGWIERDGADLVLMDMSLPDLNGFAAARRIKARSAAPLVVLLSFFDNQTVRLEAWAAGADGVVAKPDMTDTLTTLAGDLLRAREATDGSPRTRSTKTRGKPADVFEPPGGDTGERGSS